MLNIHLRELFATDNQTILVDKVEYNFNQLLSLGLGEQGEQGIQGDIGPSGPTGSQGEQGERGNYIHGDNGHPDDIGGLDLIDNDHYFDYENGKVYKYYSVSPGTWEEVVDFNNIIVAPTSNIFTRDWEVEDEDRFIVFKNHIKDAPDSDILFLHDFNDLVDIPGFSDIEDFYNSLETIYVDQRTDWNFTRNHLSFGSIYENLVTEDNTFTIIDQNLKIKHVMRFDDMKVKYNPSAIFNMSVFGGATANITNDSLFEFITSKISNKTEVDLYFGPKNALAWVAGSDLATFDGIVINNSDGKFGVGIESNTIMFKTVDLDNIFAFQGDLHVYNDIILNTLTSGSSREIKMADQSKTSGDPLTIHGTDNSGLVGTFRGGRLTIRGGNSKGTVFGDLFLKGGQDIDSGDYSGVNIQINGGLTNIGKIGKGTTLYVKGSDDILYLRTTNQNNRIRFYREGDWNLGYIGFNLVGESEDELVIYQNSTGQFIKLYSKYPSGHDDIWIKPDSLDNEHVPNSSNSDMLCLDSETGQIFKRPYAGDSKARYTKDDGQTIPTGNFTKIEYDDIDFDNLLEYNQTSPANYGFIPQDTGYYIIKAIVTFNSREWAAGKLIDLGLFINGSPHSYIDYHRIEATITNIISVNGSGIVYLEAGKVLDIRVRQDSGGDAIISNTPSVNYFTIHRLS